MAKQLLREFFELCPDGNCVIDVLTESERRQLQEGGVFLVGVCQKAATRNGNCMASATQFLTVYNVTAPLLASLREKNKIIIVISYWYCCCRCRC